MKFAIMLVSAIISEFAVMGSVAFAQAYELGEAPRLTELSKVATQRESAKAAAATDAIALVNTGSRANVVAFFNATYMASENIAIGWTGNVAGCVPGVTSQAYTEATLLRVNFFRAMAGLPANVVLDTSLNAKDQSAALMMSAAGTLSHMPPPTFACYTAEGADAAAHSNLALGIAGAGAIDLYMDDPGANNYFVGHRRWILHPPQVSMGTGSVPSSSGNSASNALWVLASFGTRPSLPDGVAWPPSGFVPYQVMPKTSGRWSISYPSANFSNATVTMSTSGANVPVVLETQVNDQGFGDNTLVWRPQGITYGPLPTDVTYTVDIGNVLIGGVPRSFSYDVTVINPSLAVVGLSVDFDADGADDVSVYQTSTGHWFFLGSTSGFGQHLGFGGANFLPVPGDYDGDGKTDIAVYDTTTGNWFIDQSTAGFKIQPGFGGPNFVPVPGDYDGDGKMDVAVYDKTAGHWFFLGSTTGFGSQLAFGGANFIPVPGDYDGDGKVDRAVYDKTNGNWFIAQSTAGFRIQPSFGGAGFVPVPGDYDNDGKVDVAVYQTSTGHWFLVGSTSGFDQHLGFGGDNYMPVPGDYDGDGETDTAVYDKTNGNWFISQSTAGFKVQPSFGGTGFVPVLPQVTILRALGLF